jgi:hypothetical protein
MAVGSVEIPPSVSEWNQERRRFYCSFTFCEIAPSHIVPYIYSMEQHAITLDMVSGLTDDNLRECGIIRVGDRVRIRQKWADSVKRAMQTFP